MRNTTVSYRGKTVFVGIDVHKSSYVITCMCDGEVVKRGRLPAEPTALGGFCQKQFPGAKVHSAYEAGFCGFRLHRMLCAQGITNLVVHPAAIEISARDRVKTDKRDSAKIAAQLAAGRLQGIRVPTEAEERRRLLTRTREQLVRQRTRLQNQLRMRLHQFGLLPPMDTRRMSVELVAAILRQDLPAELRFVIESLSAIWQSIAEQLRQLERQLQEQAREDPLEQWYRSVPGIGPWTARVLANELGDLQQFPNERRLFSFTGLTPCEYSSGDARRLGRISRQGAGRLRHVLIEAAWVTIRQDPALAEAFKRIAHRAGKKRAIVAIARKLIGRVRASLRTRSPYEVGYRQAA